MKKVFESKELDYVRERLLGEIEKRTYNGEDVAGLVSRAVDFVELLRHERPMTHAIVSLRLDGRKEQEIAAELGVSQQAVSKRIRRIEREL